MAVGGLLDLDDMLAGSNTAGPSGLGGIDLGGVPAQAQPTPAPTNDMGFGFDGGNSAAPAGGDDGDWANAFGNDDSAAPSMPVAFAKPEMHMALHSSQPG